MQFNNIEIGSIIITKYGAFKVFASPSMKQINGNNILSIPSINLLHKASKPFDIGIKYIPISHIIEKFNISINEFIKEYPEKII